MIQVNLIAGQRVRLKHDSSAIGVITGKVRDSGGRKKYQVQFPADYQYVPDDQLEILPEGPEHPIDLFESGKISYTKDLRRVLAQVRLNGKLVDIIYSMEISNTDFYAYQYKPVLKLLNSPNNGILIADEVGLGKTIESALIWTELKSRFDLRKILVLCPAVLREKWQLELRYRFGIEAEILDGKGVLDRFKRTYTFSTYNDFAIISSMQGLRTAKSLIEFINNIEFSEPLLDCLIIDEAHYLRNPETKTAKLGRLLRNISDYVILLSATPIQLRNEDLFQLVNLIDNATFQTIHDFMNILQANAPIVKAKDLLLKKDTLSDTIYEILSDTKRKPLFSESKQLVSIINQVKNIDKLTVGTRVKLASNLENLNLFSNVITRTRKREVTEWRVVRDPIDLPVSMSAIEQEFYEFVTNVVRDFCSSYEQHEGFLLISPQRQMASSMAAAAYNWKRRIGADVYSINEDFGSDPEFEPAGSMISNLIAKLHEFTSEKLLYENDSKYIELKSIIEKLISEKSDEKIVLFSYFRATLFYLRERLKKDGISSIMLIGGMKESKIDIIDEFRDKNINVLLSSEVGSEGIDLQFCRILINYDLPWNPMKVEQRIGRIDRIGQQAEKINIINMFYDDTIDSRIYERLYKRLQIFQNALGDLESILGEKIRDLSFNLLNTKLTKEEEIKRIEQTAQAVENIKIEEDRLEKDAAYLVAHGDYILNQIKSAKELNRWISDKDIQTYVIEFYKKFYPGSEFIQTDSSGIFDISLPNNARNDLEKFMKDEKIPTRTNLIALSSRPFKYIFKNKLFPDLKKNVEIINQIHPVIRYINNYYYSSQEIQHYPAVAIELDLKWLFSTNVPKGIYLFSIQKWSIDGLQYLEKLDYSGYDLNREINIDPVICEKLISISVQYGEDWLTFRNNENLLKYTKLIEEKCIALSDDNFYGYESELRNQNEDRAQVQIVNLKQHLKVNKDMLEQVKLGHQVNKRESLVKATQGKINALENRVERRLIEIEKSKQMKSKKEEICLGVINVK
ncbi:MAG: SNF2-related protein [Candidatus Thorarchaeota archaeon]